VCIPGTFTPGVALCHSEDDSCGYISENCVVMMVRLADQLSVNCFRIAHHPNVRTKVYNYHKSAVRVAMETSKSFILMTIFLESN
jgi:hypothetical protein